MILNDPCHEIRVLFVLRKLILQMRMLNHPVGLDVWFSVSPFVYFHTSVDSEGSDETAQMRRLDWAFAGCLYDKYHNLMSWLNYWYRQTLAKSVVLGETAHEGAVCSESILIAIPPAPFGL